MSNTVALPPAPAAYLTRLTQFLRGSYPPLPSILFALAWTFGVTGLYAATDPHLSPWRPGLSTILAAVTLTIDLLLMRALDDIRDLDYDRDFHPTRPLASGAVHVRDLITLYAAGTAILIVLNLDAPTALLILLAQLAYTALLIVISYRWQRPTPDNLIGNMLASLPAPLLLHVYLYARFLNGTGHGPTWRGIIAIAAVVLAAGHLEMAKKLKRSPKPSERTYVNQIGLRATLATALIAPIHSVALILLIIRDPAAWSAAAVLPLAFPALAARSFWREHRPRWPAQSPAFYLLATFISYLILGLAA
jgi:hypothetical protein